MRHTLSGASRQTPPPVPPEPCLLPVSFRLLISDPVRDALTHTRDRSAPSIAGLIEGARLVGTEAMCHTHSRASRQTPPPVPPQGVSVASVPFARSLAIPSDMR
jgi:hypothetical protein